jgi:hypothetical protein
MMREPSTRSLSACPADVVQSNSPEAEVCRRAAKQRAAGCGASGRISGGGAALEAAVLPPPTAKGRLRRWWPGGPSGSGGRGAAADVYSGSQDALIAQRY